MREIHALTIGNALHVTRELLCQDGALRQMIEEGQIMVECHVVRCFSLLDAPWPFLRSCDHGSSSWDGGSEHV